MAGNISGLSVAYAVGGLVMLYSGYANLSVAATLRGFLSGKIPKANPTGAPTISVSGNNNSTGDSGFTSAAGGSIVAIAESYIGKLQYVFGGPPPPGTVDCSSFASKVLNQAGIANPGGSPYSASTHGPSTLSYLTWSGATTIGNSASLAQPGDLVVWQTHMGICVGPNEMVSAQDPALGVGRSNIQGAIPGEILFVRRLKDVPQVGPQPSGQPGKSVVGG